MASLNNSLRPLRISAYLCVTCALNAAIAKYAEGILRDADIAMYRAHLLTQDARRDAEPDINLVEHTEDENLVAYSM